MLTVNFLQRFLFKWKYAILIILIISALAAAVSYQINRWLPNYALSFSHLIAQQFHTKISFNTVNYRFPNYVIFKNVKVLEFDGKIPMLQSSKMTMSFSFPLFSPATPLRYIIVNDLAINMPVFKHYLGQHHQKISSWAKAVPKGSIRLLVPNGRLYLKDPLKSDPVNFTVDLSIAEGHVIAHGFWGDQDRFDYQLNGNTHPDGFDLEHLSITDGRSSANLWGSWRGSNIDWKGYIFYDRIYILDIDGSLKMQEKNIILKQLSFSVDGDGVGARGLCSKQNLFQCDADITYLRREKHLNAQRPLRNVNLHLHAQNTAQGISFKGWSDFYFIFNPDSPASLHSIHLDFEDLKALLINGNSLKLGIKQIQSVFTIGNYKYKIPFDHLLASLNFEKPYQKVITLSSRMSAGHCFSRIFLNTASLPWQIKSQGSFEGVRMAQGLLSGTFNLQSSKNTELSGTLALQNGNFSNTRFQAWAATALQMPSLENVSDANLSCRFKINGKRKIVEDLKLDTGDVDLSGFFHVDTDNLVSSQGSIRFSKKLLSESIIGRHIIGLVRGAWTLPFEFRLSGNMYRVNFQWDKSPLKDKVREHMFSFFERMIDQRMDAHPYYKVTIPSESVSPG